jgi:hypothetical protein
VSSRSVIGEDLLIMGGELLIAGEGRGRGRKQRTESFLLNLQPKLEVFAFRKAHC